MLIPVMLVSERGFDPLPSCTRVTRTRLFTLRVSRFMGPNVPVTSSPTSRGTAIFHILGQTSSPSWLVVSFVKLKFVKLKIR